MMMRPVRIAAILARRDLVAQLTTIWIYAVASAICLVAAVLAAGFRRSFATESVLVSAEPLASVHAAVLVVLALVLGTQAAAALSWEREHRTLDVLLSGPSTAATIVVAKLLGTIGSLLVLGLVYAAYLILLHPIGDAASATGGLALFGRAALLVLPTIGLGLLVSALAPTVRFAVIAFLCLFLALSGLEAAVAWLNAQDPHHLSLAAVYTRGILSLASDWLRPVSPASYVADVARFAGGLPVPGVDRLLGAVALCLGFCLAGIVILRSRGAAP
jgi:hypothetical protein